MKHLRITVGRCYDMLESILTQARQLLLTKVRSFNFTFCVYVFLLPFEALTCAGSSP